MGILPLTWSSHLGPEVTDHAIEALGERIAQVHAELRAGTCPGGEMTGWLDPCSIVTPNEMARLKATAKRLRDETDVLLVIGIGGSYLGARAVVEALADEPERVVYAGINLSAHYITRLKKQLAGKRVAINVISKSGTTTEPAVAFRLLKDLVPEAKAKDWIVATTDANKGALLDLAHKSGYETFVVPDNIGGRFSVLSAVGLLPIAYAGIDVDALVAGADECADLCEDLDPIANPALHYAAIRNVLYNQGKVVEVLAHFDPRLHYFAEWWKQLFGESEGKDGKAIFPASVDYTADLHSMGQYMQEGRRMLFETFLIVDGGEPALKVPKWDDDSDGMNYLAGRDVNYVNQKAYEATAQAHREGGVPNLTIHMKRLDAHNLGALIYLFELSCAISALLLGVNPFVQPGVEAYKKIMFKLLGKETGNR